MAGRPVLIQHAFANAEAAARKANLKWKDAPDLYRKLRLDAQQALECEASRLGGIYRARGVAKGMNTLGFEARENLRVWGFDVSSIDGRLTHR